MKYSIKRTSTFKKQFKKILKSGKYREKDFIKVLNKLLNDEVLEDSYKDHQLKGILEEYRELHIKPDWLLIYKKIDDELVLLLLQTGSHSELFE